MTRALMSPISAPRAAISATKESMKDTARVLGRMRLRTGFVKIGQDVVSTIKG